MDHILVITTCPDAQCAEDIAQHLVRERLAACVNQLPGVRSVYEWKGEIQGDNEILLLIKTRNVVYEQVEQAIRSRHPYEVPEVIGLSIEKGSANYISWIDSLVGTKP